MPGTKEAALFFDIDGTIVSDILGTIPESTIEALSKAKKCGHKIFINTGRTACSTKPVLEQIEVSGYLCGCGTYIVYNNELLFWSSLPKERGYRYIDKMKECNVEGLLEGTEDIYFSEKTSRFEGLEKMRNVYAANVGIGRKTTMEEKNFEYDKLLICTDENSEKERFFEAIKEDLLPIDRLGGIYECVQKDYSKATAIEYMRTYLGFTMDQIYVFGDSSNDMAMFEYAKHTIAMGQHDPVLEPFTEYITDTVEDDGIYKAMKHYGLI